MDHDEINSFLDCKLKQCNLDDSVEETEYRFYMSIKIRMERLKFYQDRRTIDRVFFLFVVPILLAWELLICTTNIISGAVNLAILLSTVITVLGCIFYVLYIIDINKMPEEKRRIKDKIKRITKI